MSVFKQRLNYLSVPIVDALDECTFWSLVDNKVPTLVKNGCFGQCTTGWTLEYLDQMLSNEDVVIHESSTPELNFMKKNFTYRSYKFSEFAKLLQMDDTCVYLRSTNRNPRSKKVAHIADDFPAIANDLQPPIYIPYGFDNKLYHSSVLRIASAKVQIWTHFDLYDNVLCQISGRKRVVLAPPEDTKYLYIEGDKSRVDCFDADEQCLEQFPLVSQAKLYRCYIEPGDYLFIPSLWWHNIRTVPSSDGQTKTPYSIGFNIFWRDSAISEGNLYSDNDVYGNKNLTPYDYTLVNLDKAFQHYKKLPSRYRSLYKVMIYQQFCKKFDIAQDRI